MSVIMPHFLQLELFFFFFAIHFYEVLVSWSIKIIIIEKKKIHETKIQILIPSFI